MLRRRAGLLALVVMTAAISTSGGAQSAADPSAVSIGFLAIGRDGAPVTDLKPEDVSLRVDGRPRTLASLRRIDVAGAAGAAAANLPPPYGTNAGGASGGGRLFFFVIEDASFRPGNERLAKQAIDQFLGAMLPQDRAALVTLPHTTVRTDATTAAEVRAALAKVNGIAPPSQTDDEQSARTRQTLDGLRALLASLAAVDTAPTVVFISSGMSATTRVMGQMGASSGDLSTEHFQNVGAAAAAARAQVYVAQGDLTVSQRSDGLENLAGVVGAQVMPLAAAGDNPLKRIAAETSVSYVATFTPEPSERNGQNHRLELRVTRPDIAARVAPTLPIPRADARAARKGSANPRDMVREGTVHRDLPLRVAGFVSRDVGDKLKLVVVGEPTDPATRLAAAVVGVYDAKGKLTLATATPESLAALPVMLAVNIEPGPYRIRLAASDASGRGGTADQQIAAELVSAGPLRMSALLLGVNSGGFCPLLEFGGEPAAFATLELYGKPPSTLPLRLELAASADGPALQQAQPAGSATKDPDRFVVSGTFDIAALAPGDYVVRAIVGSADTGGEGRVTRTLRKVKR